MARQKNLEWWQKIMATTSKTPQEVFEMFHSALVAVMKQFDSCPHDCEDFLKNTRGEFDPPMGCLLHHPGRCGVSQTRKLLSSLSIEDKEERRAAMLRFSRWEQGDDLFSMAVIRLWGEVEQRAIRGEWPYVFNGIYGLCEAWANLCIHEQYVQDRITEEAVEASREKIRKCLRRFLI